MVHPAALLVRLGHPVELRDRTDRLLVRNGVPGVGAVRYQRRQPALQRRDLRRRRGLVCAG